MVSTLHAWWLLARPAGLWLPPLLPLLGYAWAHWDRALLVWRIEALPWLLMAWIVLQAGTLWLNAARDQDTGEVLLGRAVAVPPHTAAAGGIAVVCAVLLALGAGWIPAACTAACAVLAVLYSHPKTAWKGHPVLGPAVNVVGYGLLSPAAGYAIVATPLTPRTLAIAALIATAVLGWTFIAQAFQEDEDRQRGDRTLVATHGEQVVLAVGRACSFVVGAGLGGLTAIGWFPLSVVGALPFFVAMDQDLAKWMAEGGSEGSARRLVRTGIIALALLVTGAAVDYLDDSFSDQPLAGLGTHAGHPSDRRPLPPSRQQARDFQHRAQYGVPYHPN